uniref:Uncharacterized protein n=1 Tax=Anopheles farauti TaxID=69004 RepID=A0A182Q729_9DIPT
MPPLPAQPPPPAGPPVARERHHHRRRAQHGLYFHSSPPKVLQMNNHLATKDNDYRSRDAIKPSNIRIWLHHKQMSKLAKVLWAGQGMRLRTETSHHPRMKRFLECVPHVMGVIKDIHQAVIDNDLDVLKEKTAPPAPRVILTSKDANGLTPLHKAAGLAHTQIVEYILSVWPSLSSDEDHSGKTPLHWAASAKNNARSFNLLVQAGADETALDDRHKPAEYYKNKSGDIDRSLLSVIPEAPRISQQGFPSYFDWAMFTLPDDSDEGSQPTRMKPFLSQNNLLDADASGTGEGGTESSSVSKSKSVHNLTNGVLTELGQERETNGGSSAQDEKIDAEKEATREANGEQVEQAQTDDKLDREETPAEQAETIVERDEQISTLPAGSDANGDVMDEANGGNDFAQAEQTMPEDIVHVEEANEDVVTDASDSKENGHTDITVEDAEGLRNDSVASRSVSAKVASAKSTKSNGTYITSETDFEKETSASPIGAEDAEDSKDSLEQVEPKDDEIEQDSLGKDLEELAPDGERAPSAISGKESMKTNSPSHSRATTGKSIKSTVTVAEQENVSEENGSRMSSATVHSNGLQDTRSNGLNGSAETHDTLDMAGNRVNHASARSTRQTERNSGNRTYPNSARESTTPTSRPVSRIDDAQPERNAPRAASSTLTPERTSGKSSNSSATNRSRKSVISNVSAARAETQPERHDGAGDDDSDANDDSSNADVQIASYRTPNEV